MEEPHCPLGARWPSGRPSSQDRRARLALVKERTPKVAPRRGFRFGRGPAHPTTLSLFWSVVLMVSAAGSALPEEGAASLDDMKSLIGMSLDQLLDVNVDRVYGASKYEQKISQAPSSVTIVT